MLGYDTILPFKSKSVREGRYVMKKLDFMLALSAACLCFSSVVDAANFYWVGVSNDWRNAASYSSVAGGPGGTQMPGAEDRVVLSANLPSLLFPAPLFLPSIFSIALTCNGHTNHTLRQSPKIFI